ncbi:MAG: heavy metal translocating P-type ATPase [Phycisphaerae bacterium]
MRWNATQSAQTEPEAQARDLDDRAQFVGMRAGIGTTAGWKPAVHQNGLEAHSTGADVSCSHCGLPVPAGLVEPSASLQFCCTGCRTVYDVIRGCGLENYYRLRSADDRAARPASVSGRTYSELDDPTFATLYVRDTNNGLKSVELLLEGIHCNACVWLVEKLPMIASHVVEARLDLGRSLVRIAWNPARGSLSTAAAALDSLGYTAHPARDTTARELRRREDRKLLIKIAVAGALAGNVMLLAFALYGGMFTGIEASIETMFRYCSTMLGVLSLAWPGGVFFRGAIAAIRTRTAHLDLPIAIGLSAGAVAGVVNTILGRGEIYFDSLCVLVFLLLIGRWIQRRQQRSAADSVELLYCMTPSVARVIEADRVRDSPIEAVAPGMLCEVRAGETIPVDGVIEAGSSAVDQSLLTGESQPQDVTIGAPVCAGTLNVSGVLRVRAEATGEASRVGKLMALVQRSAQESAPIVRMADRIAGYFTVGMISLATFTFGIWALWDVSRAIDHATALLIVTCPCALGLATPLSMTVAIGRAARRGILIKGGESIEVLARTGTIVLDKTGTLTEGKAMLLAWHGDESLRAAAVAVESCSSHPIARAIVSASRETQPFPPVTNVRQIVGGGIVGQVDGREIVIGSRRFLESRGASVPADLGIAADRALADGCTPIFVASAGVAGAVAVLGDPIRADARQSLDALRKMGWRIEILSGDHSRVVAAVAERLGVPAEQATGDASPEDKLARVRELQGVAPAISRCFSADRPPRDIELHSQAHPLIAGATGPVIMVGDGINDAAALRAATIGIAVHGGAEASLSAASVYLNQPGLSPIVELIAAGRRATRVIRMNLCASLCYNILAAALAMTGILNPLIAAILMPLSSLTVVSIAVGGRSFSARSDRASLPDGVRGGRSVASEPGAQATGLCARETPLASSATHSVSRLTPLARARGSDVSDARASDSAAAQGSNSLPNGGRA